MKLKSKIALASVIFPDVWAYLDNYSTTAPVPVIITGCTNDNPPCVIDDSTNTFDYVVDADPVTYYTIRNHGYIATMPNLWMTLDYGVAINVQTAIFASSYCDVTNCWVTVGNNVNPTSNSICGAPAATALNWTKQGCNLSGRYVSIYQSSNPAFLALKVSDFRTWPFPSI
jgi:hypothetical protein